jgi:hypothetical protein
MSQGMKYLEGLAHVLSGCNPRKSPLFLLSISPETKNDAEQRHLSPV